MNVDKNYASSASIFLEGTYLLKRNVWHKSSFFLLRCYCKYFTHSIYIYIYSYRKVVRRNANIPVDLFVKFPLFLCNFIKTWNVVFTVRETLSIQNCNILLNGCQVGICGRTCMAKLTLRRLMSYIYIWSTRS